MKLILLYGGGDGGESYFDAVQPIEYESKEKLKQDLFVLVRESMERWKNRRTWTIEQWQADRQRALEMARDANGKLDYERFDNILKNEMGYINEVGDFNLCGLTINAACFCKGGYDYFTSFHKDCLEIQEESINENVLTLEEWFEREKA